LQQTCLILNLKLKDYLIIAMHKGFSVVRVVKEVGSGVNDNRRLVVKLLQDNDYDLIVCKHKYRLSRVGFNYLNESSLNSKLIETLK
jgi:predicted site-specific integrase-resolvase